MQASLILPSPSPMSAETWYWSPLPNVFGWMVYDLFPWPNQSSPRNRSIGPTLLAQPRRSLLPQPAPTFPFDTNGESTAQISRQQPPAATAGATCNLAMQV